MATSTTPQDADERDERLRRRLLAARAIAGLTVDALAEVIQERGLAGRGYSAKTIGNMERAERSIRPQDIPVLAAGCDLPPEFFTIDLGTLRDDEPAGGLTRRVGELEAQLAEDATRLAQLEEAVRALTARDRRDAGAGGPQR